MKEPLSSGSIRIKNENCHIDEEELFTLEVYKDNDQDEYP